MRETDIALTAIIISIISITSLAFYTDLKSDIKLGSVNVDDKVYKCEEWKYTKEKTK